MIDAIEAIIPTVWASKLFRMAHGNVPRVIFPRLLRLSRLHQRRLAKANVADRPTAGRFAFSTRHSTSFVSFLTSRSSPRPPPPPTTPLKSEPVPTRVSSRRRQPVSRTLSPSNNTNQSSNSSSVDAQSSSMPNSPSVSLVLTRHQQQWTTTPILPQTITSANPR